MKNYSLLSSRFVRTVSLVFGCALGFGSLSIATLSAADSTATAATSLPVTGTFEKTGGAENPYTLTLKNTSQESLKLSGKVLLAVAYHAESKARVEPDHTLEAGKSWTISNLALGDKVVVTAAGYSPVELTAK